MLEVRAGGPAIGYTQTSAQMYLYPDITLGTPKVDEQIQLSAKLATNEFIDDKIGFDAK